MIIPLKGEVSNQQSVLMKTVFEAYAAGEAIPVQHFVKNRKLAKYFNRETAAAVVCAAKLLRDVPLPADVGL